MAEIFIGIDGGGTYTRVIAAERSGRVLATTLAGAASPNKTIHAKENVQGAVRDVVTKANCTLADVAGLVAGIAGLDAPTDLEWANQFTELPGLDCPRLHVNDAVVAHAGALRSRPGIIAISGTGSIIFGVTESRQHIRNYDFRHYAYSAARHLSYDAVYRILAGSIQPEDTEFVAQVLTFWQVEDLAGLRELGLVGFATDRFECNRLFGEMAPLVTAAALKGVPLTCTVCDAAIDALGIGIQLLGNAFADESVPVALIGGAINSDYIHQGVENALSKSGEKRYTVVEAAFPSEVGAFLLALTQHGIKIDDTILSTLKTHSDSPS